MNKRSMLLLFSVVFMDMVGFGFIIPILPDYVSRLGADAGVLGFILASYALGQFIAAPIVGKLSDRFGRKPLFLFSIFGTMLSLLTLGFARSIPLIFLSRILDGLTGGNITVAQSYISDITDESNRARGLGLIGAAFGLGFIFGPLFGGLLVQISLSAPAFVAAGIAAINLLLINFVLPESLPAEKRAELAAGETAEGKSQPNRRILPDFTFVAGKPRLLALLNLLLFYSLAFSIFQTMFSPHAMQVFDLSPALRSYILAYIGVVIALAQGLLIGRLMKHFDENKLLLFSGILLSISLAAWAVNSNLIVLLAVMIPLAIAGGLLGVLLRSKISKEAGSTNTGVALGLSTSLESFSRVIAPILGGFMLSLSGPFLPGVFAAVVLAAGLVLYVLLLALNQRRLKRRERQTTVLDGGSAMETGGC